MTNQKGDLFMTTEQVLTQKIHRKLSHGFTLIELLIVMTVIIILAGIMIPSFRGFQNDAWLVKAENEVRVVQTAIESYYRNHKGLYPEGLEDLIRVNPRILTQLPQDPFETSGKSYGYRIIYKKPGNEAFYVIYTNGPNREKEWVWDEEKGIVSVSIKSDDILVTNAIYQKMSDDDLERSITSGMKPKKQADEDTPPESLNKNKDSIKKSTQDTDENRADTRGSVAQPLKKQHLQQEELIDTVK